MFSTATIIVFAAVLVTILNILNQIARKNNSYYIQDVMLQNSLKQTKFNIVLNIS